MRALILYYVRTRYYQSTDTLVSSALALLDSTFVCGTKYKNRAKSAFSVRRSGFGGNFSSQRSTHSELQHTV